MSCLLEDVEGLPQVELCVGAPRPPALGQLGGAAGILAEAPEGVADPEVGRAGTRRDGRARASRRSRPSTARCRAGRAAGVVRRRGRRRGRARCRRRRGRRPGRRSPGRAPAASAASRGRPRRAVAASGNRWVSPPTGSGSGRPCCCTIRAVTVRAPATLTCCPTTVRTASSWPSGWPGTRRPGRRRTSRPISASPANASSTATGSQSASSIRRTRSTAAPVSRRSASRNVAGSRAVPSWSVRSSSSIRTVPGSVGQVERAGVPALAGLLDSRRRRARPGRRAAPGPRRGCGRPAASASRRWRRGDPGGPRSSVGLAA